ncbi:MAG: flagellar basal body rod protein FlgB [Planctomycetota bacterium]|nr:flagellar basal body rod protein FlgB [Planctomycetota bacterium]
MDIHGNETELIYRLLAAASLRAKVIAGNIANQNTPGYKRRDVRFDDALHTALASGMSIKDIQPEVFVDHDSPARPDGNNVSLENELSAIGRSRLLYETYATILAGHFELMRASIEER